MTGYRTMIYTNGERYEGEWNDGLPDGSGTLFSASDKITYTGLWNKDQLTSKLK